MTALTVYLQNTWFRLKERQEGQTMAEYALILGLIAIFVMVAVFFLGGKIKDLFQNTGCSVQTRPTGSARSTPARRGGGRRRLPCRPATASVLDQRLAARGSATATRQNRPLPFHTQV